MKVWWVDPGLASDAHQSHSVTFLSWIRKSKYNERLVGKDKERSLISYCHGETTKTDPIWEQIN